MSFGPSRLTRTGAEATPLTGGLGWFREAVCEFDAAFGMKNPVSRSSFVPVTDQFGSGLEPCGANSSSSMSISSAEVNLARATGNP
jgi:hypothetical protein